MEPSVKFFFICIGIVAFAFLFVPILARDEQTDCNNYPDGAGGYFLKCKNTHMSLYTKFKESRAKSH